VYTVVAPWEIAHLDSFPTGACLSPAETDACGTPISRNGAGVRSAGLFVESVVVGR